MATTAKTAKKKVIISYLNLTSELLEAFKALYPLGYSEALTRIDKPNGEFFYVVPLETEEISYMVKVDVKIDTSPAEELEKELYGEGEEEEGGEITGADQIADAAEGDDD